MGIANSALNSLYYQTDHIIWEIQKDTNATKRFCGMLKGLLKAIKILQKLEG
jgi:hypothetical protein